MKKSLVLIFSVILVISVFSADLDDLVSKVEKRYGDNFIKIKGDSGNIYGGFIFGEGFLITNYSIAEEDVILDFYGKELYRGDVELYKVENGLYFYKTDLKSGKVKDEDLEHSSVKWYLTMEMYQDGTPVYSYTRTSVSDFEKQLPLKKMGLVFTDKGEFAGIFYNYHMVSTLKTVIMNFDRISHMDVESAFSGKFLTFPQLRKISSKPPKQKAWLGITFRLDENNVKIQSVYKDSPAESAGLKQGDIIIRVEDTKVSGMKDLISVIDQKQPGDKLSIHVKRDGDKLKLKAELGSKSAVKKYMIQEKLNQVEKIETRTVDKLERQLKRLEEELAELREKVESD